MILRNQGFGEKDKKPENKTTKPRTISTPAVHSSTVSPTSRAKSCRWRTRLGITRASRGCAPAPVAAITRSVKCGSYAGPGPGPRSCSSSGPYPRAGSLLLFKEVPATRSVPFLSLVFLGIASRAPRGTACELCWCSGERGRNSVFILSVSLVS